MRKDGNWFYEYTNTYMQIYRDVFGTLPNIHDWAFSINN